MGNECRVIMPTPGYDDDLAEGALLRVERSKLSCVSWWKELGIEGVVLYSWGDPRYLCISVRTLNPETRVMVEDSMRKLLDAICLQSGATAEIVYGHGYPALMNHEKDAAHIRKTVVDLFGEDAVVDVKNPAMPAEDFSYYTQEKEGCFVWLGTAREGETPWPLHNSRFDVDEDILWRGASLLAQTAIDYLK